MRLSKKTLVIWRNSWRNLRPTN